MTYTPKGSAVARNAKLGRAAEYAEKNAKRRAAGDPPKSPSANRKKRKHGR